mgnify:CR=1 FL=1
MNHNEFIESLKSATPPKDLGGEELALWYAAKDDWEMAHNTAQEISTETASWIHAYLHRWEGDISNSRYWYHRAQKEAYSESLEEELEDIIHSIFSKCQKK